MSVGTSSPWVGDIHICLPGDMDMWVMGGLGLHFLSFGGLG